MLRRTPPNQLREQAKHAPQPPPLRRPMASPGGGRPAGGRGRHPRVPGPGRPGRRAAPVRSCPRGAAPALVPGRSGGAGAPGPRCSGGQADAQVRSSWQARRRSWSGSVRWRAGPAFVQSRSSRLPASPRARGGTRAAGRRGSAAECPTQPGVTASGRWPPAGTRAGGLKPGARGPGVAAVWRLRPPGSPTARHRPEPVRRPASPACQPVPRPVPARVASASRAAAMNSRQFAYRRSGSLASTRANTSSIAGGRPGRSSDGGRGDSWTCAHMIASFESFSNGARPVRHS